jgi:hypothetical protein
MSRERWKLTLDPNGQPEVDQWGNNLTGGISLLAELAKDPGNGLKVIAPGIYGARKTKPERWIG